MVERAAATAAEAIVEARDRAYEAFVIGSHGTPSGVWFADVTIEDVVRDAEIVLALLNVAERAIQYFDTGRGDLDGALDAFVAAVSAARQEQQT